MSSSLTNNLNECFRFTHQKIYSSRYVYHIFFVASCALCVNWKALFIGYDSVMRNVYRESRNFKNVFNYNKDYCVCVCIYKELTESLSHWAVTNDETEKSKDKEILYVMEIHCVHVVLFVHSRGWSCCIHIIVQP